MNALCPLLRRNTSAVLAAVVFAMAIGGPARADDRDLLREAVSEPFVFILLDSSGSMHWSPKCPVSVEDPANPAATIQVPANSADCAFLCPTGDCFVPRNGDDPNSKLYQAKQALYEVLAEVEGINFGFATYNQDQLQIASKHWIYQAAGDGPSITGYGAYPRAGDQETFGDTWTCDEGSGNAEVSCISTNPADLNDAWEIARARRVPKGGLSFTTIVTVYVRQSSTTWRIRYEPQGTPVPGASVTVRIVRERCTNSGCTSRDQLLSTNVVFNPLAEYLAWDNGASKTNPQLGYFTQSTADVIAANTCSGWDPNTDTTSDRYNGYSARWPTVTGDARGTLFDIGDVVPLDWDNDHRLDVMKRLAPNTVLNATAVPDFSVAPYFQNKPTGTETFLRLKSESVRPIVATGSTPLGYSVRNFRKWFAGCDTGTCAQNAGWKAIAAPADPDWGCRPKYLLVLTDGDDTCSGVDPCAVTSSLHLLDGVITYVVGFGMEETSGNKLGCMAANGGSGAPIYPQNKDQLVRALTEIFGQIVEAPGTFASAAVPAVQTEVEDRIYLTSFTPLNGESTWDGHLDAFLKPLPLNSAGKPNESIKCSSLPEDRRSSCHLWDAGDEIMQQAPTRASIDAASTLTSSVLKIGAGFDQRRVFYATAPSGSAVPRTLRLFVPPTGSPSTDPEWIGLFAGLGISTASPTTAKTRADEIIAHTLAIKHSTFVDQPRDYLLGDVFHANPALIDRPNDFFLYGRDSQCILDGDADDPCSGYKAYADRLSRRRKMLVVGSNDGQLHFFDAGYWNAAEKRFTTGTGRELFSYIPRLGLPILRDLAEKSRHIFGVDNTSRVDDVFIDPAHGGTPTANQREWRTVLIGGFREGGSPLGISRMSDFMSGYFAVDITQPDVNNTQGSLPSCLSLTNQTVSGCGTVPFPALLWEFWDGESGARWDEDLNGYPDLGETWSVPTIGRIRVVENGLVVSKHVAIFGGGMDSERKTGTKWGDWLYMVDIETGKPLYKRRLVGSVASDPAVIDVDLDGYLDTLYVGTTSGFLYKVNMATPAALSTVTLPKASSIPALAANVTTTRIVDTNASVVSDGTWDPVPVFDTIGRPIYYAPVVLYVRSLNRYALAFGTGDRENLWATEGQEGRFYLIIDDNYGPTQLASGLIPLDEMDYQQVLPDATNQDTADYIVSPPVSKQRGWFLKLAADERVITQAFGLSGIVTFAGYIPSIDLETNSNGDRVCTRGGDSRIYVVYANNANAMMTLNGQKKRYRSVPAIVTNPYVDQGATKNPDDRQSNINSEQLSAEQLEIMEAVKKFYPSCAKFANFWISISGMRSDTGYERYATIPIGICQRNWKEF